ncbi:acyltransferase family protein [Nocardiopsis aegyptia]|uniref:acyltransferase family protein n=1 Tax=Nocardiopsis aegyptia TaxID=220378 RepID=UPI00366A76CA
MSVPVAGAAAASADAPSTPGSAAWVRTGFRPEIEGLRAIAVVLVAVYHIWFGRVSGGVDVFLVLTGFLITGSLMRALERDGRIGFVAFWTRLLRRLAPAAAFALGGVLAATYLWLPRSRWADIMSEVRAAALYHENWALARAAVDYLARDAAPSPVQHFWSLSIQGQFYVLWPVLLTLAAFVAARARLPVRHAVLAAVTTVLVCSLAYSVWITASDQAWAYFDTGARLWELALGAVLALTIHRFDLPAGLRTVMGWVGVVALVTCGLLLPVATLFPGYVALWPTGAAVLVILAGNTGSRFGADRLLTWRPLTALGGLSYGIYLWHWPILVCYLYVTDRTLASPLGGAAVLALSLALAWVTHKVVEGGTDRLTRPARRRTPVWSLGLAAAFLVPVVALSLAWSGQIAEDQRIRREHAGEPESYPGALAVAEAGALADLEELPVLPDPVDAQMDLSAHHTEGCHVNLNSTDLVVCDRGPADAEHTLAVVGASRTAHWYPALAAVAEEHGWRLVSFTKSGCQFSTDTPYRDGGVFTECQEWDAKAMAELERLRPDAVFTSSTRATPAGETIPEGFAERWLQLGEWGIDVVAMRDLPRLDYQSAECVERGDPERCTSPATYSQAPSDPVADADLPSNVTTMDLTRYVCPSGECDAVVGNVLVFWDHSHMTATYARTLSPMVEEALLEATGW